LFQASFHPAVALRGDAEQDPSREVTRGRDLAVVSNLASSQRADESVGESASGIDLVAETTPPPLI
jgi:hypothetical protein